MFTKHPMIGHDLATLAWFMALCYRVVSSFALCCEKVYKQCIASHEISRFSLHFSDCWDEMTSKIGLECDDPKVHLKARWFDLNSSHSRRQDRKPFCLFPQRIKEEDDFELMEFPWTFYQNARTKNDWKFFAKERITCLSFFLFIWFWFYKFPVLTFNILFFI